MATPSTPAATSSIPQLPVANLLAAVSSLSRWHILRELSKGEPLPVCEIAARLRSSETSISKHIAVLRTIGIVDRSYGLYAIDRRFVVPGERTLDFGSIAIRFDAFG